MWRHASTDHVFSRGAHLLGLLEGISEAARLLVGRAPQVARAKRALIEAARLHHHVHGLIHGLGVLFRVADLPGEARGDVEALARRALRQRQAHCGDVAASDDLHEQVQAVAPVRLSGRLLGKRWMHSKSR